MSGPYKTFYSNGNTKEEGHVFNDKWDGVYRNNYENGHLREKKIYNKGS